MLQEVTNLIDSLVVFGLAGREQTADLLQQVSVFPQDFVSLSTDNSQELFLGQIGTSKYQSNQNHRHDDECCGPLPQYTRPCFDSHLGDLGVSNQTHIRCDIQQDKNHSDTDEPNKSSHQK